MISGAVIAALVGELITICSLPIAVLAIVKLRTRCKLIPFFAGIATFLFFVTELENLICSIMFTNIEGLYAFAMEHYIGYIVWRVFTVELFELGGIWVVFKYILKPFDSKYDAITFGLGFAGLEAIFTSGLSAFFSLSYSLVYNELGEEGFRETFAEAEVSDLDLLIKDIKQISEIDCIAEGVRRCICVIVTVSFVMLIFFGIRKKASLYTKLAIALKAVYEIGVSPASFGLISNIYVVFLIYLIFGALVIYAGYKIYKAYDYDEVDFRQIFL